MALIAAGSAEYELEHQPGGDGAHLEGRLHHPRAAARSPCARRSRAQPALPNLLLDPRHRRATCSARRPAGAASSPRRPTRAFRCRRSSASLAYFDSYRTARLPQNLTQAQRDAFGAHTFERVERPGFVHASGSACGTSSSSRGHMSSAITHERPESRRAFSSTSARLTPDRVAITCRVAAHRPTRELERRGRPGSPPGCMRSASAPAITSRCRARTCRGSRSPTSASSRPARSSCR